MAANIETPEALLPANDADRLAKLRRYEILDTPEEETFDKIAILAAEIFDTSSAYVTFVDKDRVFFKANVSALQGNEVPRAHSFCSLAILHTAPTVIEDTFNHPEFLENPFVTAQGGIRFYAGAPLLTSDGFRLGTVCAIDSKPHTVTEKQLRMLTSLSAIAMDELEQRERIRTIVRLQTDHINMTVHDLRQPVTSSLLYLQVMREQNEISTLLQMSSKVASLIKKIDHTLNGLLNVSKIENGNLQLEFESCDIEGMLKQQIAHFEMRATQKNQRIFLTAASCPPINADKARLIEIFENFLSNALKYSSPGAVVNIILTRTEKDILLEFRDQGLGLNEEDMQKLFVKFAKLSASPTGKEKSYGLGLSIVKILVELHQGKVWATSEGKNKGSSFFVSFPFR